MSILLSIFFSFFVKSYQVFHDCNSSSFNSNNFGNESLEFIISCPGKKIQKIPYDDLKNFQYITIFEDSNIIFECSSKIPKISKNLLIFDKPQIKFSNHCFFNNIKIFNSPEIVINNDSKLSAQNIFIYNNSYNFPIKSKNITYIQKPRHKSANKTNIKSLIQNKVDSHYCADNFTIIMSDNARVICNLDDFDLTIEYYDFSDYQFEIESWDYVKKDIYINFTNVNADDQLNHYLRYILPSIAIPDDINVIFTDFLDFDVIESNLYLFDRYREANIWTTLTWRRYLSNSYKCPWVDGKFKSEYQYLEYYFDNLEKNTRWRKFCEGYYGFLFKQDEPQGTVITISHASTLAVLITIIVIYCAVFISTFFIVYYRWKKIKNE